MVALLVALVALLVAPASARTTTAPPRTASTAQSPGEALPNPPNRPERGLVYDGLERATEGRCRGQFRVRNSNLCTHGPDEAPPGVDVTQSEAPPAATAAPVAMLCDGDGVSGRRTQVIYARSSDRADRYSAYLASFRQWAAEADTIYNDSAAETGGSRRVRFVHDASCIMSVANAVMAPDGDDNFNNTESALRSLGYNRTDRKYLVFVDAEVYCGIGSFVADDQPGAANTNNGGPSYGRSDTNCWNGPTVAHEHMHNLGGVQFSAPNTSGGAHCVDEYDLMCYSDVPNHPTMQIRCPDRAHDRLFDCNHDDYFHTNPPAGSYLATKWNTARSGFLLTPGVALKPGVAWADVNGDAKADYCQVVGAWPEGKVQCTLSTGSGFGASITSGALDWGYDNGRVWVDANGDRKADYCRAVGNWPEGKVQCTLSTGSGFGATFTSAALDWGQGAGQAWADVNGDAKADYCRVVGTWPEGKVSCTLSTGSGFGATITSGALDWGYDNGRVWVDANGDRKADYCRAVGNWPEGKVQCTLSTGSGFGATFTSAALDWGQGAGQAWADVNGDAKADYCRVVGTWPEGKVSCSLSTGSGFGATISSGALDWGYDNGRVWVDANGDRKADYCRAVGNWPEGKVQCTLSTGSGFGATFTSGALDWGYDAGRAWVDVNGDATADYCRRVGPNDDTFALLTCTTSTGTAFGATFTQVVPPVQP